MTNSLSLAHEIETSKVNLIFPHLRDNFNMLLLSITHHIQTSPISDFFFFFLVGVVAVVGLCCCEQTFSSHGEQGLLSSCNAGASHCGNFSRCRAWALGSVGFGSCGACGLSCPVSRGILVPGPGIEPVSPALAGKFLNTEPPGKSHGIFFN